MDKVTLQFLRECSFEDLKDVSYMEPDEKIEIDCEELKKVIRSSDRESRPYLYALEITVLYRNGDDVNKLAEAVAEGLEELKDEWLNESFLKCACHRIINSNCLKPLNKVNYLAIIYDVANSLESKAEPVRSKCVLEKAYELVRNQKAAEEIIHKKSEWPYFTEFQKDFDEYSNRKDIRERENERIRPANIGVKKKEANVREKKPPKLIPILSGVCIILMICLLIMALFTLRRGPSEESVDETVTATPTPTEEQQVFYSSPSSTPTETPMEESETDQPAAPDTAEINSDSGGNMTLAENRNLRESPTTEEDNIYTELPAGEEVTVLERVDDSWLHVKYLDSDGEEIEGYINYPVDEFEDGYEE